MLDYFISRSVLKKALTEEKIKRGKQILKGVLFYKLKGYNYGLGKTNFMRLFSVYKSWSIFWIYFPIILLCYMKFIFRFKKIDTDFKLSQIDFIKNTLLCLNCNSENITLKKNIIKCSNCSSRYIFKDNVLNYEKTKNIFEIL